MHNYIKYNNIRFIIYFRNYFKIFPILMFFVFNILLNSKEDAFAKDYNCYSTFYKTNDFECVDRLVTMLSKKFYKTKDFNHSNIQGIVGFLTEIFRTKSKYKDYTLKKDVPLYIKSVFMVSLYRAGLTKEAKNYASYNSLEKLFGAYKKNSVELLTNLKPRYLPYDNDFLIGAFMASGNKKYIFRIIENYKTVSLEKAEDAFRVALVKNKFGTSLSPKVRKSQMLKNICIKYECKKNQKDFYKIMTLSTAYWSLNSLAKKHQIIKDSLNEFFKKNKQLKNILYIERNNFFKLFKHASFIFSKYK